MAGQEAAAVFDTGSALQGGLSQVAELTRQVAGDRHTSDLPPGEARQKMPEVEHAKDNRTDDRGGRAFPAFIGTDQGREAMFTESAAGIVGGRIAGPIEGQGEEEQMDALAAEVDGKAPGSESVERAENGAGDVGEHFAEVGGAQGGDEYNDGEEGESGKRIRTELRDLGPEYDQAAAKDAEKAWLGDTMGDDEAGIFAIAQEPHAERGSNKDRLRYYEYKDNGKRDQPNGGKQAVH